MKLLTKNEYSAIEELLRAYDLCGTMEEPYKKAMEEIIHFFNKDLYKEFLDIFYLHRYQYIHRYPSNSDLFVYLSQKLFVQQPTLYVMRKEIIYKAGMVFYKYQILT